MKRNLSREPRVLPAPPVAGAGLVRRSRPARSWRVLLAALTFLGATGLPSRAADEHPPLRRNPELNFNILLQQALLLAPEYVELASRDEEARLHLEAGRSWIAGRPSLAISYLDDQPRTAMGLTELEYGIEVPLRRPGEKREARVMGENFGAQASAWKAHLELTIAGRLRRNLADLETADRMLELEKQATADARALVQVVEKMQTAGDVAQADVLQVRAQLLQQQRQELAAETELVDAQWMYSALTGLSARPAAAHVERRTATTGIGDTHPWLRLLQAGVAVADSTIKHARAESRGSPSVMVGSRRQRGSSTENYNDSVILGLNLPIGASAAGAAKVGSFVRQKADAEMQLLAARHELQRQLHEATHELGQIEELLVLAEEQASLDRRQWEMAKTAFEAGETNLFPVLTALRQTRASARELEALKLRQQRLISEYNQVIGVLP
jgi:cobalt-zinc-cadmium efflux system outer membrane protein